jgi:hypothetical protein
VTVRRQIAGATMLLVALSVFNGCGGSSGISSLAGAQLQLRVAAIRDSAARGDRSTAESQLSQLRVDVVQFRADNKVNDSAATRILRAADAVEAKLALLAPPPAPTTTTSSTTTTTTTTTRPPKPKGHDDKHGKKRDGGG